MKVLWISDPHFNFLGTYTPIEHQRPLVRYGSPQEFAKGLLAQHPDAQSLIITGGIAEAPNLRRLLTKFSTAWGKAIYFILGNHDFYSGSFASVYKDTEAFAKGQLVWLTKAGVVRLNPTTALVGTEGWYDGRAADPRRSGIQMSDFTHIKDFRGLHPIDIHQKMMEIARDDAKKLMPSLREACSKYKNVIVATHVPPFKEATWHEGNISNDHWLPWMCNLTMGEHLIEVAHEFPETKITVLCGHTHSPGEFKPCENLCVLTGKSDYWYPQIAQVLNL